MESGGEFDTIREAIARLATAEPLLVVQEDLFTDLVGELGSIQEAVSWLVRLATRIGHPIATHVEGTTTFLSPPGWSNARLQGWAAVHETMATRRWVAPLVVTCLLCIVGFSWRPCSLPGCTARGMPSCFYCFLLQRR